MLRIGEVVKMFGGNMYFFFGVGMSVVVGVIGRVVEVDIRVGDGGCVVCYIYSFSKGILLYVIRLNV